MKLWSIPPFSWFTRKKDEEKRKKKILLWTLIPISLIVIALSILLGCLFGCKESTIFIFKDGESVRSYIRKHKSVHKGEQHFNKDNLTHDNRQYLRNNVNGQNLLNGMMSMFLPFMWLGESISGSKWEIKHGNEWASIRALDIEKYLKNPGVLLFMDISVYLELTNEGFYMNIITIENGDFDRQDEGSRTFGFLDDNFAAPIVGEIPYRDDSVDGIVWHTMFQFLYDVIDFSLAWPPSPMWPYPRFWVGGSFPFFNLVKSDFPNCDAP